jgi:hypothetical protein
LISGSYGEVYLIGGVDNSSLALRSIYKLENAASTWQLQQQMLQRGRYYATAFSVPDDIVRCSKGDFIYFKLYNRIIISLFILESSKILVGGGYLSDGTGSSFLEVLDTENPKMVCQPFPNFPLPLKSSVFGFLNDNSTIIVCTTISNTRCFKFVMNSWIEGKLFSQLVKHFYEIL